MTRDVARFAHAGCTCAVRELPQDYELVRGISITPRLLRIEIFFHARRVGTGER